jgi:Low molecular weight phosphotyrosine protein phosphatase
MSGTFQTINRDTPYLLSLSYRSGFRKSTWHVLPWISLNVEILANWKVAMAVLGCSPTIWACRWRCFSTVMPPVYQAYRKVDLGSMERLVVVYKENICRSAYAEALAKSLGVNAVSCGLNTKIGLPADESAIQAAMLRRIDLTKHRTMRIETLDLKKNDLFIAMEPWQAEQPKSESGKEYDVLCSGYEG